MSYERSLGLPGPWYPNFPTTTSGGTVTSVGLTMPGMFSVAGSPITTAGTFAVTFTTQAANQIFAGPTTGAAAVPTFRTLVAADLSTTGTPDATTFLRGDMTWAVPGGGGTVTSVALTMPGEFSVTGSPITGAGTFAVTFTTQAANQIFAGPTTGAAATPTFRTIVAADLSTTGTPDATTFLRGDMTWATPASGSPGGSDTQVQFNNAGAFAGASTVTYNSSLSKLTITQNTNNDAVYIEKTTSNSLAQHALYIYSNVGVGITGSNALARVTVNNFGMDVVLGSTSNTYGNSALLASTSNSSYPYALRVGASYAGASTVFTPLAIVVNSSSTPTSGYGGALDFLLKTSTTITQDAGRLFVAWSTATHASRTSAFVVSLVNNASSLTERFRIGGDGMITITAAAGSSALRSSVATTDATYGQAFFGATTPQMYVYINRPDASYGGSVVAVTNSSSYPYAVYAVLGIAASATRQNVIIAEYGPTSAGVNEMGAGVGFRLKSTTTASIDAAQVAAAWSDATHATRTSYLVFSTVNNASALTERMRLTGDGTLRVGTSTIYFGLKPAGSGTPVWTMPSADGTANQVLQTDGAGVLSWATVGGTGTVTSVALTAPIEISVAGSPITTAGTLALTWATQTANVVFAGPASGGAATPAFRALVADDIPNLDAAKITTGTMATARLGSGTADATTFLRGDQTWASPTVTTVSDATFRIQDNVDTTKQIAFEASSIATTTTRTITMPDRNVTLDTLVVGTTQVTGGSASRLLQQDASGFFSYQPNLSYASNRFAFRSDGAVGSAGNFDVQVNANAEPGLYLRNYYTNLSASIPALDVIVDASTATNATHTVLQLSANSNGTAAAGFGTAILWRAESSTTASQDMALTTALWSTATHASRTARYSLSLVNNAAALAEVWRVDGPGNTTSFIATASTASLVEAGRITLATSGTPAAGLGVSQVFALESSTTGNTDAAFLFTRWTDPTHASFQAMFGICVYEGTGLSGSSTSPNFAIQGGGSWLQNQKTATTNAVVTAWTRALDSSGTPVAGFGLRDVVNLDSNSTPGVTAAAFDTSWIDPVTATATSQWQVYLSDSGALTERYRFLNGGLDLRMTTARLYMNGTQVLTNRITGWAAATGTATRATFDTSTVTTPQLAERVKALLDDCFTHGFIST